MEDKSLGKLHEQFMHTVAQLGITYVQLPMPIYAVAPIGISFEVGTDAQIYMPNGQGVNHTYIDHALLRAKTLYDDLPCAPDLLRIDVYPKEEVTSKSVTLHKLAQIGLPEPDESVDEAYFEEDTCYIQEHLYWNIAKGDVPIETLLLEIIKGDLGGTGGLCSNVYFMATKSPLLYYLYDDRGVDILANEKACLQPFYQKFNQWILACEKEKADSLFAPYVSQL